MCVSRDTQRFPSIQPDVLRKGSKKWLYTNLTRDRMGRWYTLGSDTVVPYDQAGFGVNQLQKVIIILIIIYHFDNYYDNHDYHI